MPFMLSAPRSWHCTSRTVKSIALPHRSHSAQLESDGPVNPRAAGIGHAIEDEYAAIREHYCEVLVVAHYRNTGH